MKFKIATIYAFVILSAGCSANKAVSYKAADIRSLPCHWFLDDPKNKYHKGRERARKFSNEIAIYAIAAYKAYEKDIEVYEDIPFPYPSNWTEQEAGTRIQADIGFAARSWIRKIEGEKVELVIAYRGTDSFWKDFSKANLVFAKKVFGRTQLDAALEYANDVIGANSERGDIARIILTGHSLGGGLAEYVQRLIPNSQAVSFDASPNQGSLYSLLSKTEEANSIRVYEKGEVLSYFRYALSPDLSLNESPFDDGVKAIWYDFYDSNPVSAHGMHDLAASLIKVSASTGNRYAKEVIKQLELRRDSHSLPALTCNGSFADHRIEIRQEVLGASCQCL